MRKGEYGYHLKKNCRKKYIEGGRKASRMVNNLCVAETGTEATAGRRGLAGEVEGLNVSKS